jgi:hypothetical protein
MIEERSRQHDADPVYSCVWAFETAWAEARSAGRSSPDPAAFLVETSDDQTRRASAFALAMVDLEHRLKMGDEARVDDYTDRFAGVTFGAAEVRELIRREFLGRLFQGDDPPPDSFRERFPEVDDQELHAELCRLRAKPANNPKEPRYRIISPHRRGGLGVVYLALDRELRRRVALKEMP